MAAEKTSREADATSGEWNDCLEESTHQELNRIPNIHMLKKPSWATDEPIPEIEGIEELEYQKLDITSTIWKSLISIPLLMILALPAIIVLSFTLAHQGIFPDSMTPQLFKTIPGPNNNPFVIATLWALVLIAFVPWSITICKFDNWISTFGRR
ncbi:MAG: hypothetical protein ABIG39_00735 [Candidatus Micrarchaeota archaeon]